MYVHVDKEIMPRHLCSLQRSLMGPTFIPIETLVYKIYENARTYMYIE